MTVQDKRGLIDGLIRIFRAAVTRRSGAPAVVERQITPKARPSIPGAPVAPRLDADAIKNLSKAGKPHANVPFEIE